MSKAAQLVNAPWRVKLSLVIMGLGQLCYGQIIKGLLYILSLAGLVVYFAARGAEDLAGIFTLGTKQENLWLGIEGDNSMQMLIMGLFAVMVLVFALALYVSNVRDVLYTSREAAKGRRPTASASPSPRRRTGSSMSPRSCCPSWASRCSPCCP